MKTFEYKTVEIKPEGKWFAKFQQEQIDKQINELGKLGWELVAVVSKNVGYGSTEAFLYTFKRSI